VPAMVMDHPTVQVMSDVFGPLDGIIGFPLFARYKMTLDYQARQMTFVPSGYEPADIVQALMATLLAGEKPAARVLAPGGVCGLRVHKDATDEAAGVIIKEVLAGSAAAAAGLRAGDRLLTIDGRWTDSVTDCYQAAGALKPGTPVKVRIQRDGEEKELSLTPQAGL